MGVRGFFFFQAEAAYEVEVLLEFSRLLLRSHCVQDGTRSCCQLTEIGKVNRLFFKGV